MTESPRGLPIKETLRLSQLRRVMAQTMKTSVQTAALSQVNREIDVTVVQQTRRQMDVSLNTLLMIAVARTLPAHPLLNAELVDNQILVYEVVNLGMAVAVPDGLMVVVIPNAQRLPIAELDQAISERVERIRNGKPTLADVEGGTFTVSNLGMYGIDGGFPIPRPPEGAILLIGAANPKPAVHQGEIVIRDIARFSLNFDHRFIDGATAAAFLRDLNNFVTDETVWEGIQ